MQPSSTQVKIEPLSFLFRGGFTTFFEGGGEELTTLPGSLLFATFFATFLAGVSGAKSSTIGIGSSTNGRTSTNSDKSMFVRSEFIVVALAKKEKGNNEKGKSLCVKHPSGHK